MNNPLIYVSIILLVITTTFLIAYFSIKDKKEARREELEARAREEAEKK